MSKKIWGYTGRFIILHVITYVICGVIFMKLQNYEEAFSTMEAFKLFRSLDHPLVAAAMPIQILRGALLALLIYPIHKIFINRQHGWLLLFGIIYGFTFLVRVFPDLIFDVYYTITTGSSLSELLIGPLEVTIQMLIFSYLLFKWEMKLC